MLTENMTVDSNSHGQTLHSLSLITRRIQILMNENGSLTLGVEEVSCTTTTNGVSRAGGGRTFVGRPT